MTRTVLLICLLALAGMLAVPAGAAETVRAFDSPAQRSRYYDLLEELRCMVCQNESLASSKADLAEDMRDEVYRLIVLEDRTNEAAIQYLTDRYGEFILYRPPVEPTTWLLWFGPLLMLAVGGVALGYIVRGRRRVDDAALSPAELARAEHLLRTGDEP